MTKHTAQNSAVFRKQLADFVHTSVEGELNGVLSAAAQEILTYIDEAFREYSNYHTRDAGNKQFPIYHGQMHDSTGAGVYINGILSSFIPQPRNDGHTQKSKDGTLIWGRELLTQALALGQSNYSKGVWIVVFSAVPYAEYININGSKWERGAGYFELFKKRLVRELKQKFGKKLRIQ